MNFLPENPNFADLLDPDVIGNSQPMSLPCSPNTQSPEALVQEDRSEYPCNSRPKKHTGQQGEFRSIEEIDPKYRGIFTYPYFNLVQSRVIEDALYSDKSIVVCAPTGSGKTVVFEMAIAQLLMDMEEKHYEGDFKIIYMAPVKALCTERLTEWYPKLTKLGLMCIEVTGDTDVEFPTLKPYKVIITTPEKWDMLTRRWRDYRGLVEVVKLFLIDEVHILNDNLRGPVLEAVVSRMKTIESSVQSAHRIEKLRRRYGGDDSTDAGTASPTIRCNDVGTAGPRIRFVAASATVSNPQDVAAWLGAADKPAVYYKFGDECRPVKIMRVVEGYPCPQGTSIFKFDIILNYKLWPIIQKYHNGKPTLIFCNTRKSVALTADALSREITINFNPEQKAKLTALASTLKNKKLQALILNGVGCHHAGLLYEERMNIEYAFRNRHLPILITTTTLAMGVNLPAHLVIIKNTQQYVNGAYQEYSISTILQMVGRAGRPQFDTTATAVIMTRMADKARYQALVEGTEPLESFLHKRLAENLNSEAALGTVTDVAQCVQWVNSTFLSVRAAKDPRRYLGLPNAAPANQITKKIEELCVKAMNGLASSGLITMDENSCIESTEAGKLMSVYYIDLETMKLIMKIDGSETLDRLVWLICESHELSDMHLRVDERRCLNALNRSNNAATIRFPMKGKISSRQMKLNCVIQAVLGCLPIADPSLNQEAMKIMRIALRVCKCLVAYTTRPTSISQQPKTFSAVLNSIILTKCLSANLWENSPYVSKQLRGIGPAFSMMLASAGKTTFMLLEESHPRDLERIMNKGPPAGNVIRKQISLLPKYQLTITPIDRDRVSIQLMLLNQAHLSENLDDFTAGVNHKSYIVVGDSENYLLYLTAFKDTDLINIYDGRITCEVARKHCHEHKITAHCVSSTFEIGPNHNNRNDNTINIICNDDQATYIAEQRTVDRKRKNTKNIDVACSKEKIKRDNHLFQDLKSLKESFGKTSKEIMGNIRQSTHMSEKILENLTYKRRNTNDKSFEASPPKCMTTEDNITLVVDDDTLNNDEVLCRSIMSEIENEMGKTFTEPLQIQEQQQDLLFKNWDKRVIAVPNINETKRKNKKQVKCNFNIIDLIEEDNMSDDEKDDVGCNDNAEGFTNTVKSKIDQYLQTAHSSKSSYKYINNVVHIDDDEVTNIGNDESSPSEIKLDEIVIDYSQVQRDHCTFQNKSHKVDENLILQNMEEKTNEKCLEVLANKKNSFDDNDCKNPSEYNEIETLKNKNVQVAFPKDINDTSSSLVIIDDTNEIQENRNDINFMISTSVPLENYMANNAIKYEKNHRSDRNVLCNNNSKAQNLSDIHFEHDMDSLCCTTIYDSTKIAHGIKSNIPPVDLTSTPKINDGSQTNLGINNELHESNKYQAFEIHKPCINSSKENQLELKQYSVTLNSNANNIDLCHSTNNSQTGQLLNRSEDSTNIYHGLKNNIPPVDLTIVPKMNDGSGTNIGYSNELHERNKYQVIDIHKPCISSLRENKLEFKQYSEALISNVNNIELGTKADYPLDRSEQDAARIEKYCYRTTQFNVCSKDDDTHTVKIISKFKIDLDITKIVSTKQKRTNSNVSAFNDIGNEESNDFKTIEAELNDSEIPVNVQATTNQQNIIGKNISNSNMHLLEQYQNITEAIELQSSNPEMATEQTTEATALQSYPENAAVKTTETVVLQPCPEMTTQKTVEATVLQPNPRMKEPEQNEFHTKSIDERVSTVGDILKKYSNIMSSRNPHVEVVPVTKKINNDSIVEPSANKPKRRYRINDLVNSITKEPNKVIKDFNLINFSSHVINQDKNEVFHDDLRDESLDEYNLQTSVVDVSQCNMPEKIPILTDFTNDDCETNIEISGPDSKMLELPRILSLNNSMLNPKTLLESYSKDNMEEVIPPPAEFSDDNNLAIQMDTTSAYSPLSPDYDPFNNNSPYDALNKTDYEPKDLRNIYCDVSHGHGEMSPVEENTDTWSMSPEDQQDDTSIPFSIQKRINSCNVTKNISGINNSFSFNRNNKLNDFKYKRKATFNRIRKQVVSNQQRAMPRKYVCKVGTQPLAVCTEDALKAAFEELRQNQCSVNEISRRYGIEKRDPEKLTLGKHPISDFDSEKRLVTHIRLKLRHEKEQQKHHKK